MLPELDDNGYLPPGVHLATFEEIAARFGWQADLRRVQTEALAWLIELVRRAGAERLVVKGSYVTAKLERNDVDCLILTTPGFPRDPTAEAELLAGVPFMEIQIVAQAAFDILVHEVFSSDRDDSPKGMVEVELRTLKRNGNCWPLAGNRRCSKGVTRTCGAERPKTSTCMS